MWIYCKAVPNYELFTFELLAIVAFWVSFSRNSFLALSTSSLNYNSAFFKCSLACCIFSSLSFPWNSIFSIAYVRSLISLCLSSTTIRNSAFTLFNYSISLLLSLKSLCSTMFSPLSTSHYLAAFPNWTSACFSCWLTSATLLACWLSTAFAEHSSALKFSTFYLSSSLDCSPSSVPMRTEICSYLSMRIFSFERSSLSKSAMMASFCNRSCSSSWRRLS